MPGMFRVITTTYRWVKQGAELKISSNYEFFSLLFPNIRYTVVGEKEEGQGRFREPADPPFDFVSGIRKSR